MAIRIKVSAEARDEMLEAAAWYNGREGGLGMKFLAACDKAFEEISIDPRRHLHVGDGFHRYLMPKFPFAVFYEIQGDALIIAGVVHGARNPARWRRRLGLG
jgi:toxin ParE1/3/4